MIGVEKGGTLSTQKQRTALLPNDDLLASLLGLETLHAGGHLLRSYPKHGEPIGGIWVSYFWKAIIKPSFSKWILICGAEATQELAPMGGNITDGWRKVIIATDCDSVVLPMHSDPVAPIMRRFDLLPFDEFRICLDGVGYEFEFKTVAMHVSLSFGNPRHGSSRRDLEIALFSLSSDLVKRAANENKSISKAVDKWARHF